jgi:hypothetical protein
MEDREGIPGHLSFSGMLLHLVYEFKHSNKGIQATALQSTSKLVKTSTSPPPHLMPQPLAALI